MDVCDVIANLAEACRKDKIRMIVSGSTYDNSQYKTTKSPPLNFNVPVFDMGQIFDPSASKLLVASDFAKTDYANKLLSEGMSSFTDGTFSLPFPICFFVWHSIERNIQVFGKQHFTILYCCGDDNPSQIICIGFQYIENDVFYQFPFTAIFDQECLDKGAIKTIIEPGVVLTGQLDDAEQTRCGHHIEQILAISVLIEQKSTIYNEAKPTKLVASVNAGRARGKLSPLGPVTKIEIGRDVHVYGETRGKGSKSGSDVRSHLRHLQSGKVIRIRAHTRKGGKPNQSIYEVRS